MSDYLRVWFYKTPGVELDPDTPDNVLAGFIFTGDEGLKAVREFETELYFAGSDFELERSA